MSLSDQIKEMLKDADGDSKNALFKALQAKGQEYLSDAKFIEQFEIGKRMVKERGDDELAMQFWLFGRSLKDGSDKETAMPVMLADWNPKDDAEKQKYMRGIGALFAEKFPEYMLTTVVQISEAWMVRRDADSPEEDSHVMPRESPDRIEVAFCSAMSMDQRNSYYSARILRNKDGKYIGMKDEVEQVYDPNRPKEGMKNFLSAGIFIGHGEAKYGKKKETA